MLRNTWKPGDHLVIDDESGLTHYASEMARDWDGQMRHRDNLDGRHPQLDVKARRDPVALRDTRERATLAAGGDYLVQENGVQRFGLEDNADFCILSETITVR